MQRHTPLVTWPLGSSRVVQLVVTLVHCSPVVGDNVLRQRREQPGHTAQ